LEGATSIDSGVGEKEDKNMEMKKSGKGIK